MLYNLTAEKNRINNSGNDIVKGVSSGCNTEAANCKQNRKVYSCYRSKCELYRIKRVIGIWLSAEQIYMMMCAEQRRRNEDRKYDRILMSKP